MDTTTAPFASIGIDIGKEVFHIVGFSTDGKDRFSSQDQATGARRDLQEVAASQNLSSAAQEMRWQGENRKGYCQLRR
jgi:hypothetical protein